MDWNVNNAFKKGVHILMYDVICQWSCLCIASLNVGSVQS